MPVEIGFERLAAAVVPDGGRRDSWGGGGDGSLPDLAKHLQSMQKSFKDFVKNNTDMRLSIKDQTTDCFLKSSLQKKQFWFFESLLPMRKEKKQKKVQESWDLIIFCPGLVSEKKWWELKVAEKLKKHLFCFVQLDTGQRNDFRRHIKRQKPATTTTTTERVDGEASGAGTRVQGLRSSGWPRRSQPPSRTRAPRLPSTCSTLAETTATLPWWPEWATPTWQTPNRPFRRRAAARWRRRRTTSSIGSGGGEAWGGAAGGCCRRRWGRRTTMTTSTSMSFGIGDENEIVPAFWFRAEGEEREKRRNRERK